MDEKIIWKRVLTGEIDWHKEKMAFSHFSSLLADKCEHSNEISHASPLAQSKK